MTPQLADAQPKRVLILCTGNRCRSQMAEGWLRHFGGEKLEVSSAGLIAKGVHPMAIEIMREAGVDISGQRSETIDRYLEQPYLEQPFDLVVTVCDNARESCPVFLGARGQRHHSFEDPDHPDDPNEPSEAVFRRVRDQIRSWAEALVEEFSAEK